MLGQTVVDFKGRSWENGIDSVGDVWTWTTPRVNHEYTVNCTPHFSIEGEIPIQVIDDDDDNIIDATIRISDFPSELVALSYALTMVEDSVKPRYEIDKDVIYQFERAYDGFDGGMMNKEDNTFGKKCRAGYGVDKDTIINGEEVEQMLIVATDALMALRNNTKTIHGEEF